MHSIIKHNLGIYFMLLASFEFALVGACAKILSEEGIPSIEVMFFRNGIGLLFMLYFISKLRIHKEGGHFWLLTFRGVVGTLALYLFFYNVSNISLGSSFAFQKTSPIFITLIAFVLFRENIGIKGWVGICIAFCGVLFISQPWENAHSIDIKNTILGILSGFFAALALTSVRQLRRFYPTEIIALSFILVGTLMPLASMLIGSVYAPQELDFFIAPFVMPSLKGWIVICAMGCIGTLYQIHITKSYGVAKKAGIVAGVSYFDVVFSLLLGIVLGDSLPGTLIIFGIACIVIGGIIIAYKR